MAAEVKRAPRPHPQQMVKCPRCNSSETKFCYFNNYSTTQPRYFCKNCKRYWTDGGTLRNVPVGGGLRKNKRSKAKLHPQPSSPPQISMHQAKSSSLMPVDGPGGINRSVIATHLPVHNAIPGTNFGMPYSPTYLLFNQRNFEMDNKMTADDNQVPLFQQELYSNQHHPPALPLPILPSGLKNDPNLSGAYFHPYPWHPKEQERPLTDGLQAGEYQQRNENPTISQTFSTFANVSDWQQMSEGFFVDGRDDKYVLMQPPQPPQWTDFDTGTRL